jgi:ABC-type antimicrobial peptide transport system permease subunit
VIRNNFKIAFRNLAKNKFSSFINIGGLAVGMAVAILIGLWIYDELSFNKNHRNYNLITQVLQHQHISNGIETYAALPLPLAKELRNSHGSDLTRVAAALTLEQFVAYKDKIITRNGKFAEEQFPEIIQPEMIAGDKNSLNDPASILVSESLAKTLFGDEDPLNKAVKLNNTFTQKVTGVYKDLPQNSNFHDINFIAPVSLLVKNAMNNDDWQSSSFEIFALMNEHSKPGLVSSKIKNILYENSKDASQPILFLNPMSKWHLFEFKNGEQVAGRARFVWMFGIIDVLVLLLASINFMNLSTARSGKRAKEVGIRKTIGSMRSQLIYQFFCECFVTVMIASLFAMVLVTLSLPWFGKLAGKQLAIPVTDVLFWLSISLFILFTVLLSGSYPAFYLSSFKPVKVLKGVFQPGRFAAIPRKTLVVIQFTASIALIIGTIQVYRQIQFAKDRPVGYNRERLLTIPINNAEIAKNYESFKNELLNGNKAAKVSRSSSTTTDISSGANNLEWEGKDPNKQAAFGTILADPEYGEAVKWKLSEGRNFSNQFPTDSFGFIFNESAIKMMGLKNPVGQIVRWHGKEWHIIGVTKDMVMRSAFDKAVPTVFLMNNNERSFNIIHIKLNAAESATNSLKNIEAVFKKYCSSAPFDYKFTDDAYATKFAAEEQIGKLATLFATLAIFISCLGLFGLASYIAEQRTKEIGVRKVLGASVFKLWQLLSTDFVLLVIISCCIAIPISWYVLNQWLQNYEYRTPVSWWIFLVAISGTLIITLLTVSYQAIKAAIANPVKSLRTE